MLTWINPSAEQFFGLSNERAYRQPLLQLLGDARDLQLVLTRVLETGLEFANELRIPPTEAHSEERLVDCRVSRLEGSGPPQLVLEMSDVTRRMRISRENALLMQHDAGRQMVRQLAHEVKNPLGGLRGAAQLLAKQLDEADLTEYTDVIISEADRLAGLVDTLLGPGGPPQKAPRQHSRAYGVRHPAGDPGIGRRHPLPARL